MHLYIGFIIFLIIFIIIFFFNINAIRNNSDNNNQLEFLPKQIEAEHRRGYNAYVKFTNMLPRDIEMNVYVGDKRVLRRAPFGYVPNQFVPVKSGWNEVSVFAGRDRLFTQRMYFNPYQYDIFIIYNQRQIFKTNSVNQIRFFNAVQHRNPLRVILSRGSQRISHEVGTGKLVPFNLRNGTYDVLVRDHNDRVVLRDRIRIDNNQCKIYSIAGNHRNDLDNIALYEINGACGYLGNNRNNMNNDIDNQDGEFDLVEKDGWNGGDFVPEVIDWDNEENDISDFHGNLEYSV